MSERFLRLLLTITAGVILANVIGGQDIWDCPQIQQDTVSCTCDRPHTLRCLTYEAGLRVIAKRLKNLTADQSVSLLDITAKNVTDLPSAFLTGVTLHGLVVSSGQLKTIAEDAFSGLTTPLLALGLPNNRIDVIPTNALNRLKGLDRLDLSENKLVTITGSSFKGLSNLTVLDLSDNQLVTLTNDSFSHTVVLKVLRLRGNRLGIQTISELSGLETLEELDLSINALIGALASDKLPRMPNLKTLILSSNQLTSVQENSLQGLNKLMVLSLNHNQIDVIEDHAFESVPNLKQLDLSSNRIVAVSGFSLAHLSHLTDLDLSHNFLRAVTPDLTSALTSLRVLHLDDNDITTVNSDALLENSTIESFTLSDNPINCDCLLTNFSQWFNNSTRLTSKDRETAICTTPPSLENGLLVEIPPNELKCGENEDSVLPVRSNGHLTLRAFHFDGESITLLWTIDSFTGPFTCDAIFVYEDVANNDILLSTTPLKCNSSELADPKTLTVRLPGETYQAGRKYRYCVVLLEDVESDELQLILGCSDMLRLEKTKQSVAQPIKTPPSTRILSVQGNGTGDDTLHVSVKLWDLNRDSHCHVTVTVFVSGALLAQHHLNCSTPSVSISGLPKGPYHVCATLGNHPPAEPRVQCVMVGNAHHESNTRTSAALTTSLVLLALLLLLGGVLVFRRVLRRPQLITTHQCFMSPHDLEGVQQHARYVKLQATTKL